MRDLRPRRSDLAVLAERPVDADDRRPGAFQSLMRRRWAGGDNDERAVAGLGYGGGSSNATKLLSRSGSGPSVVRTGRGAPRRPAWPSSYPARVWCWRGSTTIRYSMLVRGSHRRRPRPGGGTVRPLGQKMAWKLQAGPGGDDGGGNGGPYSAPEPCQKRADRDRVAGAPSRAGSDQQVLAGDGDCSQRSSSRELTARPGG